MRAPIRVVAATAGLVLSLAALGCRAGGGKPTDDQAAPLVPPLAIAVDHVVGGPLSTSAPEPQIPSDAAAARVSTRWWAIHAADLPPLPPLGARARLVTATRVDLPVLAATHLTRDARFDDTGLAIDPVRGTLIAEVTAAVLPATSVIFRTPEPAKLLPAAPPGVELRLFSPTAAVDAPWSLSVIVTGQVPDQPDTATDDEEPTASGQPKPAAPPPVMVLQRETAIVDDIAPPAAGETRVVWLATPYSFPRPADTPRRRGAVAPPDSLLIELRIDRPSADAPADLDLLVAQARENLARSAAPAAVASPAQRATQSLVDSILPTLQDPMQQRRGLLYFSVQTGAPILQDAALVADEPVLARLSKAVADQAAAADPPASMSRWGLALDLIALKVLGQMQSSGNVPPELRSVLLRHAGEAGRSAGAIDDILSAGAVSTRADLENRLIAENLIALEDVSPASRVRAFDWLTTRGRAPKDYDPLGPARARRDALDRALTAPASEPSATQPNR